MQLRNGSFEAFAQSVVTGTTEVSLNRWFHPSHTSMRKDSSHVLRQFSASCFFSR